MLGDDGGPVLEGRAVQGEREADVGRVEAGVLVGVREEPGRLGPQGRLGAAGQRPRHGLPGLPGPHGVPGRLLRRAGRGVGRLRRLAQHQMAVGAAHAPGADAGQQRPPGFRPGPELPDHVQVEPLQRDVRVGRGEVEARRQPAVRDGEQRLEQADDAGRALQVAHVGLGRADEQRRARLLGGPDGRAERRRLDRVSHRRAGAVQFDVLEVGGLDAGVPAGRQDDLLLGAGDRRGEPRAAAVVVDGAAQYDTEHRVAVGERGGQRLEQDEAAALAADVAVGPGVEGVAPSVRRESAEAGHPQGAVGQQVEVDATRQG